MYRKFFKRGFDIVFSFLGIVVLSVPMLLIMIVIKCDSEGPVIFKTERVGKNGKPFKFYKFRSMRTDAPKDLPTRLMKSDEYITNAGKFLRKTSLDELPQLFCILKGDMSIIGPRPVVDTETELLEYREQTGAMSVRPGLTGLAQISGRDKLIDMKLKAELDGEYAKKITFGKDFKIFFKTIAVVLKGSDIVEGDAVMKEGEAEQDQVQEVAATQDEKNDALPTEASQTGEE
ncbi:MAG: sugar transferase [Clostridia bacterium]|nr:sugar transferase [Clostridia bacterium]